MAAKKQTAVIASFVAAPRHERIKTITGLVKGDDAKSIDGRQDWLLELCEALHDELRAQPERAAAVVPGLSAILEAREALRDNGNVALALERVALALP
jgi:hypothetical protein